MSFRDWFPKPSPPLPALKYLDRVTFKGGFYEDCSGMVLAIKESRADSGCGMDYVVASYLIRVDAMGSNPGPEVWVRRYEVELSTDHIRTTRSRLEARLKKVSEELGEIKSVLSLLDARATTDKKIGEVWSGR